MTKLYKRQCRVVFCAAKSPPYHDAPISRAVADALRVFADARENGAQRRLWASARRVACSAVAKRNRGAAQGARGAVVRV